MTLVSLKNLKSKAIRFPDPVRTLILSEPDEIEINQFIAKFGEWDRLLALDKEKK